MPLQNLPLEIIYMILRLVGSGSLRKQEACCLLVSKWWYTLVKPILFEDLDLYANRLKRIPQNEITNLGRYLQLLTIHMEPTSDQRANEDLNNSFGRLLPHCTQMKTFTFSAASYFDPAKLYIPSTNYLGLWSPESLLNMLQFSILSDLTIDTCGSDFNTGVHVCPQIALKLPSLRSIRLRMRRICPLVFELKQNSKIHSVIINLSLKENDRFHAQFTRHCTESYTPYELNDSMVMAATKMAKSLTSITMLRILCHKHPYLEMVTTDCINGSQMVLSDDGKWDWKNWSDDGPSYLPSRNISDRDSDRDLFESDEDEYVL